MQNKIEINYLNHVSCFLIYTMIRISDSNPFDLNQSHAQAGLVCGYQWEELSEDKGRESKVEGELPVTGWLGHDGLQGPFQPNHSTFPKCLLIPLASNAKFTHAGFLWPPFAAFSSFLRGSIPVWGLVAGKVGLSPLLGWPQPIIYGSRGAQAPSPGHCVLPSLQAASPLLSALPACSWRDSLLSPAVLSSPQGLGFSLAEDTAQALIRMSSQKVFLANHFSQVKSKY